jgi:hypothetical protein
MNRPKKTIAPAKAIARAIHDEIEALPTRDAPSVDRIRRRYSALLAPEPPEFVREVARELLSQGHRWFPCAILRYHRAAFAGLGAEDLEELGQGMASWGAVDAFARTLAGPAWLAGRVPDGLIHRWARSPNRWWRRAALVSTVALNVRSHGGKGDARRTLRVCAMLAADRDDMVVKALSWALRELVVHDRDAVAAFLAEHEGVLAARVKREVRHKIETGVKNPRRRSR